MQDWELSPTDAKILQLTLSRKVIHTDKVGNISTIAGVDAGYRGEGNLSCAAAVLLSYPDLDPIDNAVAFRNTSYPYVPGLLAFRELPALIDAFEKLEGKPDLILCDGHGKAHPRRFGIACHLGVLLDIPTIGAGKSRLTGTHSPVQDQRGASEYLWDGEEIIGAVVRTRTGVNPIYVSIGHRISLNTAVQIVLDCCPRYRIPEPLREAHRLASRNQTSTNINKVAMPR